MNAQALTQRLNVALRRLGWPGLCGLALLALAAWVHHAWVPAQTEAVAQTESQARRLRHALRERAEAQAAAQRAATEAAAQARIDPQAGPRELWSLLWQALPEADARWRLQQHVLSTAREAAVPLGTVQWRGDWEPWTDPAHPQGLWRQRMSLPVQLPYPVLRTWLSLLLREPALTLDAIEVQRTDPLSPEVKAQVSVSLWWRQERRQP